MNDTCGGADRLRALARCITITCLVGVAAPCVAGVIDALNRVRAGGCATQSPASPPLVAVPALDGVAERLANGSDLPTATSAAGYRTEKSASIYVRNARGDDLQQLLAQRFCDTVIDPALIEAGVFQRTGQTWIVLARPASPPGVVDADGAADRVVALINVARSRARACGGQQLAAAAELRHSGRLQSAALIHARDLATSRRLGHEGSDGSRPADRVSRTGYVWSAVAENVAAGPTMAEDAVAIWLASPGHCANLMSDRYSETGVAYAVDPVDGGRVYWVQVFASPGLARIEIRAQGFDDVLEYLAVLGAE